MDLKTLWDKTLAEIELQVSKPNFLTWIKNSRLIEKNDSAGVVVVGVANSFAKEWIKDKHNKQLLEILRSFDETISRIDYVVLNQPDAIKKKVFSRQPVQQKENPRQVGLIDLAADPKTNLHPRYAFKNFVVGSSNEMAFAASSAITTEVGTKYNPLFVYGGTGLGKTHLIQAIGNEIVKRYKNRVRVKYVSSEKFVNDVVSAIRAKRMETMKQKYRDVDVLIIDDIQFIGGKAKSEEELFHTFNALYQNSKQIILSSDRTPSDVPVLDDRLRSRFEGGMIVDITHPDYEMKLAIIKNKTAEKGFDLGDEIAHCIASKLQRSVREIEGIISKLYFYKEFKGSDIDIKTAQEIINTATQQSTANINPSHVIKTVAQYFEISQADIINKSRRKEVVLTRQIILFLQEGYIRSLQILVLQKRLLCFCFFDRQQIVLH